MKLRKLFQGWRASSIFQWSHVLRGKIIYFTPWHIGLEAGSYKGNYVELTVVVLGLGFYLEWYPPTDGQQEFINDMNERIEEAKKEFGIMEDEK